MQLPNNRNIELNKNPIFSNGFHTDSKVFSIYSLNDLQTIHYLAFPTCALSSKQLPRHSRCSAQTRELTRMGAPSKQSISTEQLWHSQSQILIHITQNLEMHTIFLIEK